MARERRTTPQQLKERLRYLLAHNRESELNQTVLYEASNSSAIFYRKSLI
jgi:septum formation topological specificity factor MinE